MLVQLISSFLLPLLVYANGAFRAYFFPDEEESSDTEDTKA